VKTLVDIRAALRIRVDDVVKNPYLVADKTLDRFINEAVREACRRARLLLDATTPEICTLTVTAGEPMIEVDPRIIFIRRARLTSTGQRLGRASRKALDECMGGAWEDETGDVVGYVPDWQTGSIRLFRTPTADDTITLNVVRLPLAALEKDKDEIELREEHADSLLEWGAYRFYSLPDTEINNPNAAANALAAFEAEFGKRSTALDEEWLRENADFLVDEGNF
jgi:hypothetical protein